jgi:hypothetical protein
MVGEFIAYRKSLRKGAVHETSGDLQGELDALRKDLAARKGEFQIFIEKNGMAAGRSRQLAQTLFYPASRQSNLNSSTISCGLQNLKPDQLLLSTQPLNLSESQPLENRRTWKVARRPTADLAAMNSTHSSCRYPGF